MLVKLKGAAWRRIAHMGQFCSSSRGKTVCLSQICRIFFFFFVDKTELDMAGGLHVGQK